MPAPLPFTELEDAAIRRIYETTDVIEQRKRKARFVEHSRWNAKQVYWRAIKIGAIRPKIKEPNWTEAEIDFVLERAGKDVQKIRKDMIKAGFPKRTLSAIGDRIRKEVGSTKTARTDCGIYYANELAELLGVDSKSVSSWCRQGLLKATQTETPYGSYPAWKIKERDIRKFVINNVGRVNFGRCDQFWLVDLLVPSHGAKVAE